MLRQAKRAQLIKAAGSDSQAQPEKLNGREPRYKSDGTMYAQDIALGYVDAGWPEVR